MTALKSTTLLIHSNSFLKKSDGKFTYGRHLKVGDLLSQTSTSYPHAQNVDVAVSHIDENPVQMIGARIYPHLSQPVVSRQITIIPHTAVLLRRDNSMSPLNERPDMSGMISTNSFVIHDYKPEFDPHVRIHISSSTLYHFIKVQVLHRLDFYALFGVLLLVPQSDT